MITIILQYRNRRYIAIFLIYWPISSHQPLQPGLCCSMEREYVRSMSVSAFGWLVLRGVQNDVQSTARIRPMTHTTCDTRAINWRHKSDFRILARLSTVIKTWYQFRLAIGRSTVWNLLPEELTNSDSFNSFNRLMKTISLAAIRVTSAL